MTPDRIAGACSVSFMLLWFLAWITWPFWGKKTGLESDSTEAVTPIPPRTEGEEALYHNHIKLHAQKACVDSKLMRTRICLQLLVNKLEMIDKDESMNALFTMAELHGYHYDGPTWGDELAAAKKVLEDIR